MKPVDVNRSMYTDLNKEHNNKSPKFKIGNVRISKYENIFGKKITFQISLTKFLWLKKLKTLCHGHMLLVILVEKKLLECFSKKNYKKTNQKEFRFEKVIKKKPDELYVKWKQ